MMSFPQRLLVFGIGALLGALLCLYILNRRGLERPDAPPQTLLEAEREAIPGILAAYTEHREPLQSPYITAEFTQPAGKAQYRRVLLLEGRMPGQRLRLEEIQSAKPGGQLVVQHWRVMAADRVVVTLAPEVPARWLKEPLAAWSYRLLRRGAGADAYVVQLSEHSPQAVDQAISRIGGLGEKVIKVEPDYLDKDDSDS